jgi:hypothetical protein
MQEYGGVKTGKPIVEATPAARPVVASTTSEVPPPPEVTRAPDQPAPDETEAPEEKTEEGGGWFDWF